MNAFMKVFPLKKLVSTITVRFTDGASSGNTFIWLPFTGGISAFAVILPSPKARFQRNFAEDGTRTLRE
jgi:hypothetical protein